MLLTASPLLGDTALLKEILSYISSIKSDRVPDMQGGFKRRIKIITYGIGRVASCAFILHQIGDVCMGTENAEFMFGVPHGARLAY